LKLLLSSAIGDCFEVVISAADVSYKKPHSERLHICIEKLVVAADECVNIGNTVIDAQTAKAAGITPIGVFGRAGNSAQQCQAGVHRLIPGVEYLSGLVKIKKTG
jgi:phosphoglycolate phosphatase